MHIPNVVKVGGRNYTVEMKSPIDMGLNGIRLYGLCDYEKGVIFLDPEIQNESFLETTFLHELIHAMSFEGNSDMTKFGVDNDTMELLTDGLSKILYQVIKDNEEIFYPEEVDVEWDAEEEQKPIEN